MSLTDQDMELYQLKADLLGAAGHPIRLAAIDYLTGGEQCVCDIARHVSAGRSNVSRHLAVLLRAGLVSQRKDGLKVMYSLRRKCVEGFLSCVTDVLRADLKERSSLLDRL